MSSSSLLSSLSSINFCSKSLLQNYLPDLFQTLHNNGIHNRPPMERFSNFSQNSNFFTNGNMMDENCLIFVIILDIATKVSALCSLHIPYLL